MNAAWAVAAVLAFSGASEPEVKWIYEAQSQLYAAPLVADLHPSPGAEIVISDSDARRLRCIGADGKQLWEYDGGWVKRLTSGAALSRTARPGRATLAVGNGGGTVDCIDAETGARLWKAAVGKVEWSNVIWADLNGDGRDELVAASEETGLTALDADGHSIWRFRASVSTPATAVDVDEDGKAEVFACLKWGPVCIGGDGSLRWQTVTGDDFSYGSVTLNKDLDGAWVIYSTSQDTAALHCFDVRTGTRRWHASMIAPCDIYSAASVTTGFVDSDEWHDIVLADRAGHVYCFGSDSRLHWVYDTQKPTHAAVSLADVDADGRVEVLAASGDHGVYCLSFDGLLEWRYETELRIVGPVRAADVEADGTLEWLVCGSDHKLRCLTLGGRVDEAVPDAQPLDAPTVTRALLANGGFEASALVGRPEDYPQDPPVGTWLANRPQGWQLVEGPARPADANAAWGRDTSVNPRVNASLRIGPNPPGYSGPLSAGSDWVELEPNLRAVSASARSKGDGAYACLQWNGASGTIENTILDTLPSAADGWREHRSENVAPPYWARRVRLLLLPTPRSKALWDDARIEGTFVQPHKATVLANQAGYDAGMPKCFVVQGNFEAKNARFELIAGDGTVAFAGALEPRGRITGAFGNDWGYYYWRGSFTAFDTPGTYRLRALLDDAESISFPFEIGPDAVWRLSARPAYRFFYYQRCGMEIPGYHKACHLDDSTDPGPTQQWDLTGGWHDAGDYNKYHNAPYVLGLSWSYEREKALFDAQDEDGNGRGDFLDEILWGADHATKMIAQDGSAYGPISSGYGFWGPPEIETDNKPLTGDERPTPGPGSDPAVHAAAVAKAAKFTKDPKYIEAAARALQYSLDRNQRGPLQFSTAIDLYLATQDEKYAQLAREMAPGIGGGEVDALELYDRTFGEDHSEKIREALKAEAEALLANAKNPFGVWTFGPAEKPNFFGTPEKGDGWHVGNSARMFEAANRVAMACRYNPDPRYLEYIYDQFNWTLGCNPFNISLLEGVGGAFPPSYHQRLTFAGVKRGAIPGSVVNGITYVAPGDDRPYFDMRGVDIPSFEPNEVWLPHNTAYLAALTSLEQVHDRKP